MEYLHLNKLEQHQIIMDFEFDEYGGLKILKDLKEEQLFLVGAFLSK